MSNISKITLPDGTIYDINDESKLSLSGGTVTGPVIFGDSVSIDEATVGDLVVNGAASFTNNINANTINEVAVGSSPKFTDTVTTVTTSGSGNAITAISATNGALTATKGSTFLTSSDISGKIDTAGTGLSKSGTTLNHSNSVTAQTTQAVYPIKIDAQGHISAYGSAVTIPTVPSTTGSGTTGISIADHSTTTIYGVGSSTTSVTGVSGSTSVYGVKSGTNSTTTASKASGGNGTAPTLGTAITVRGVKTGTNSTTTASKASGGNGTAPSWTFEEKSIPNVTSAGSASSWTFEEKSIPNVTNAGSGSASLTFAMDTTDTKKLKITFSHTHTAPTLGTAIKVQSKSGGSNGSAPILGTAIKVQSKSGGSNGSASTWSFTDVTVPIRADADTSIPNVTSVGSASTWSFTDVTVPIRADSATTVPTAASSATTVPIKNSSATTVVTSKTHSVTDNGHTHTI